MTLAIYNALDSIDVKAIAQSCQYTTQQNEIYGRLLMIPLHPPSILTFIIFKRVKKLSEPKKY